MTGSVAVRSLVVAAAVGMGAGATLVTGRTPADGRIQVGVRPGLVRADLDQVLLLPVRGNEGGQRVGPVPLVA